MQQRQYRRMNSRQRRAPLSRLQWITGYVALTLGALILTYIFPEVLQTFHPKTNSPDRRAASLVLPKENVLVQTHGLNLKQELVSSHSRSTKLAMHTEDLSLDLHAKLWKSPANEGFVPCVESGPGHSGPKPTKGYLMVSTNGGLNQMRAGICDMVAIARLINATLVIPELDKGSFWQDASNFSDIFDVEYFIKALANDVPVIKALPLSMRNEPKVLKQFRSWSGVKYYEQEIGRLWLNYKVIKAAKTDLRLANNHLPAEIQKLRCRVHYDALRFAPHIEALGKVIVERLRSVGPYIALHLRYEKDMLAFSGCTYQLSTEEALELTTIRENTTHWKVKKINGTEQRKNGFCPLTPTEVGVFLKSLGYPASTRIYIAAGEIYGGRERMSGLFSRFPSVMSKENIATASELAPFLNHSSQMAALDYIVSVESDVFVSSYSGNMARAVEGHRRFLGHRKTISPDRKELVTIFDMLDQGLHKEDQNLADLITTMHQNRLGAPRKRKGALKGTKGRDRLRSEEAFYTNPTPDCLCQKSVFPKHVNHDQNYSPQRTEREGRQMESGIATQRR